MGHTVPNGDPPKPYAPGTKLCCALLLPSLLLVPDGHKATLSDGRVINLYALRFLHLAELSLKLDKGTNALLDAFDEHGVGEILDPGRAPAVRRGLFGFR